MSELDLAYMSIETLKTQVHNLQLENKMLNDIIKGIETKLSSHEKTTPSCSDLAEGFGSAAVNRNRASGFSDDED